MAASETGHVELQAQESGEQMQIQDSMLYALDGLHSASSLPTQRESAAALLDICTTRRGRLALMCETPPPLPCTLCNFTVMQ